MIHLQIPVGTIRPDYTLRERERERERESKLSPFVREITTLAFSLFQSHIVVHFISFVPPVKLPACLNIFVALVEDNATMSSIWYFENHVSYFLQNRRKY